MPNGRRRLRKCDGAICYAGSRSRSETINCRDTRRRACWQPGIGGAMKAHFRRMAAYNRWANERLYEAVGHLSPEDFAAPRSGFFPSLLKTLNHILVGDTVWMGRLDGAGSGITSLDQVLHTD
ncbi:MAG TPA: DinB family protein, partial [Dongiaceae bacterium]|nr:DinB family protein [Dongiaceae bacterium]